MIETTQLILLIVGGGVLGYSIAQEEISYYIKRLLRINKDYPVLQLLSSLKAYMKVLGTTRTILFIPLILPLMLLAVLVRFITKVVNCYICSSFWLTLALSLLVYGLPILTSILVAGASVLVASIYNLIRTSSI